MSLSPDSQKQRDRLDGWATPKHKTVCPETGAGLDCL
jgi:hypothetical protein